MIAQDHETELDDSIVKIMDYSIFKQARDLPEQLRPIANALDICQSDGASIAKYCM